MVDIRNRLLNWEIHRKLPSIRPQQARSNGSMPAFLIVIIFTLDSKAAII